MNKIRFYYFYLKHREYPDIQTKYYIITPLSQIIADAYI